MNFTQLHNRRGAECPRAETSDREISAYLPGKSGKEKIEKGENGAEKKENCKREGGKLKMEGGKVPK